MFKISKKIIPLIIIHLLLSSSLFSQTWSLKTGWELLGSNKAITDLSVFNSECVNGVFAYKKGDSSIWETYPSGDLTSIDEGQGFWVYMKKDCDFDTLASRGDMIIKRVEVNATSTREYKFYKPNSLENDASLLFYFHGEIGMANDDNEYTITNGGALTNYNKDYILSTMANTENIIVAYPLGSIFFYPSTKFLPKKTFNWNDDSNLIFFDKMVEYITTTYPQINKKKIYVTGFSNGASFSFRLAGARVNVLAGASATSSRYGLIKNGVLREEPFLNDNLSTPLIAFHGLKDNLTLGMEESLDNWHTIENKGSLEGAEKVQVSIGEYNTTRKTYKNGISDLEIYLIEDVRHSVSMEVVGRVMWDFLKKHIRNN